MSPRDKSLSALCILVSFISSHVMPSLRLALTSQHLDAAVERPQPLPTRRQQHKMADPIDPRLQYTSSLPPRTLSQSYTSGPPLSSAGHSPYYLPTPIQHHSQPPPLAQAAPPSNLDPALEQTSAAGHDGAEGSPDEDDGDHEGDHDGYAAPAPRPTSFRRWQH